jgi:predicted transcriptional regulator
MTEMQHCVILSVFMLGANDSMVTMIHRTTFALDKITAYRLKRLAARWRVSQAEVIRRSLEQAEKLSKSQKPDAIALLRQLHEKGGGLDRKKANAYLAAVYEKRKHGRGD